MSYPKCKCCERMFIERDDPDYCPGCSMAYAMAIADVVAWMKSQWRISGKDPYIAIAEAIEDGVAKGAAKKAEAKT